MSNNPATITDLLTRAGADSALRDRLVADPKGTIAAETGMTVPADWDIVADIHDGGNVVLEFENGELPEEYLAVVSGGNTDSCGATYYPTD